MNFSKAWTLAAALGLAGSLGVVASGGHADALPLPAPADSSSAAPAAATAKAEVMVLYASNDGSGIDKSIGSHPELSKPPFSSYNSYKLLDRSELALTQDKAATETLPDKNTLAVTYKGKAKDAKKGETRYDVVTSIQKPDGSALLPALEVTAKQGEFFFLGGAQKYKDGVLVIGIRVQ